MWKLIVIALVLFGASRGVISVEPERKTVELAARGKNSGKLLVATYNVAGLPSLINSADSPREQSSKTIGERIRIFDVINVQEDFNYHAYIYSTDNHVYRTPTSGGAALGSGLNTLSNLSYTDLKRVHWNSCQLDSGDCLTPKGFTHARLQVVENVHLDLYNLHANAGTKDNDEDSRRSNLAQLQSYIQEKSANHAVLVMGDTNTRYSREKDTIGEFVDALNLKDPWVGLIRNGNRPPKGSDALVCGETPGLDENTCEVVDKILYRGSSQLSLDATTFKNYNSSFLNDQGVMLSDHSPIGVTLEWSA